MAREKVEFTRFAALAPWRLSGKLKNNSLLRSRASGGRGAFSTQYRYVILSAAKDPQLRGCNREASA
jgi:hypothetical protein